uniref:Uncharacterized protein n=1 Tax=Sphaerodactylus townsendi TaxID=933632 RepID=A0ACB8EBV4_9SAUR
MASLTFSGLGGSQVIGCSLPSVCGAAARVPPFCSGLAGLAGLAIGIEVVGAETREQVQLAAGGPLLGPAEEAAGQTLELGLEQVRVGQAELAPVLQQELELGPEPELVEQTELVLALGRQVPGQAPGLVQAELMPG